MDCSFGPIECTRFKEMPLQTGIPPAICLFIDATYEKQGLAAWKRTAALVHFSSSLFPLCRNICYSVV